MSQQWYCQIMGSEVGPLTSGQLREMAESGRLQPDDLIRKADSDRWVNAERVKGLFQNNTGPAGSAAANQASTPATVPPQSSSSEVVHSGDTMSGRQQLRGSTDYASQNLMTGETILYAAGIHPLVFLPAAIFSLCLIVGIVMRLMLWPQAFTGSLVLIAIGSFSPYFVIKALIVFLTTECVLTDRRVLAKNRRSTSRINRIIVG